MCSAPVRRRAELQPRRRAKNAIGMDRHGSAIDGLGTRAYILGLFFELGLLCTAKTCFLQKLVRQGVMYAARNDRPRQDGSKHGSPASQRWPSMRRLRYVTESG